MYRGLGYDDSVGRVRASVYGGWPSWPGSKPYLVWTFLEGLNVGDLYSFTSGACPDMRARMDMHHGIWPAGGGAKPGATPSPNQKRGPTSDGLLLLPWMRSVLRTLMLQSLSVWHDDDDDDLPARHTALMQLLRCDSDSVRFS